MYYIHSLACSTLVFRVRQLRISEFLCQASVVSRSPSSSMSCHLPCEFYESASFLQETSVRIIRLSQQMTHAGLTSIHAITSCTSDRYALGSGLQILRIDADSKCCNTMQCQLFVPIRSIATSFATFLSQRCCWTLSTCNSYFCAALLNLPTH